MNKKFMITNSTGNVVCANLINAGVAANTWIFYTDQYTNDSFELKPMSEETSTQDIPVLKDEDVEVMDET